MHSKPTSRCLLHLVLLLLLFFFLFYGQSEENKVELQYERTKEPFPHGPLLTQISGYVQLPRILLSIHPCSLSPSWVSMTNSSKNLSAIFETSIKHNCKMTAIPLNNVIWQTPPPQKNGWGGGVHLIPLQQLHFLSLNRCSFCWDFLFSIKYLSLRVFHFQRNYLPQLL